MARLGNVNLITPEQRRALVALAVSLDVKYAARKHKWVFKCMEHQYFALYWNRQDMIRTKCWRCPFFTEDKQCTYEGVKTEEIDVRLYQAAIDSHRINADGVIKKEGK